MGCTLQDACKMSQKHIKPHGSLRFDVISYLAIILQCVQYAKYLYVLHYFYLAQSRRAVPDAENQYVHRHSEHECL